MTPGPWTNSNGCSIWGNNAANTTVKIAALPPDAGLIERNANARLIAAAPELLAACKRAKQYLDHMHLDWLGKQPDPLEAAIAKAEGRS